MMSHDDFIGSDVWRILEKYVWEEWNSTMLDLRKGKKLPEAADAVLSLCERLLRLPATFPGLSKEQRELFMGGLQAKEKRKLMSIMQMTKKGEDHVAGSR